MMEVFMTVLFLFAILCLFCLFAAAAKQDIEPTHEEEAMSATNDLRLINKCNELRELAARVRKETKHG